MNDSLFGGGRRAVAVFSRECLAELLNMPPGTMITGIRWEDNRRVFVVGIEGLAVGTSPPDDPYEVPDLRVNHAMHHSVEWPTGNVQIIDFNKEDPKNPSLGSGGLNLGPRKDQSKLEPPEEDVSEEEADENIMSGETEDSTSPE